MSSHSTQWKPFATVGALVVAVVLSLDARTFAQQGPASGGNPDVVQIRPDFYMIAGAGGNIAVQVGPLGVILVDSGSEAASDKVLAAIRRLTDKPIRYIISTSADADHVGGNQKLSQAGV